MCCWDFPTIRNMPKFAFVFSSFVCVWVGGCIQNINMTCYFVYGKLRCGSLLAQSVHALIHDWVTYKYEFGCNFHSIVIFTWLWTLINSSKVDISHFISENLCIISSISNSFVYKHRVKQVAYNKLFICAIL